MPPHPPPARVHAGPEAHRLLAAPLERLVQETLAACMAGIADPARAELPAGLHSTCVSALEQLWRSRSALVRAMLRPPLLRPMRPKLGIRHWSLIDEAAIDLDIETSRAAQRFLEATETERRSLQLSLLVMPETGTLQTPWALVSPRVCATVLRWAIERSVADPAARRPLLRIVADELVDRLPRMFHDAAEADAADVVDAAEAPGPQEPAAAQLSIGDMQPGQWFRLCLHGQWTMTRLSWRSDNGRFFMFQSGSAGRSHSLSLRSLERLVSERMIDPVPLPGTGTLRRSTRNQAA